MKALLMSGPAAMRSAPMLRIMAHVDMFFDNSMPFEKFLRAKAESVAKKYSIQLRQKNKIHTKVRF